MNTNEPDVTLASQSPRRAELLQQMKINFDVISTDVDESLRQGETPKTYVARLAKEKSEAGLAQLSLTNRPVIGADTIVYASDRTLTKPKDRNQAIEFLSVLSGSQHIVYTAVAISTHQKQGFALSESIVTFREISADEMELYWQSGEPKDKAGAYAIQGLGGIFVSRIEGSYSGIMGLPIAETYQLLREFNIKPTL